MVPVSISHIHKDFADFLRLRPNAPALTHLQRALSGAREISDDAKNKDQKAVRTLVDRYVSLVEKEADEILKRFPRGSRAARSQYQFFFAALKLFHEYGYRDDKRFIDFVDLLETLALLEKPLGEYSDKERATLQRIARRKKER